MGIVLKEEEEDTVADSSKREDSVRMGIWKAANHCPRRNTLSHKPRS
jgi:hypothetical protein